VDRLQRPTSGAISWLLGFLSPAVSRAFSIFLQKIIADARFRTKTPDSQTWSGIDFPSATRKSFTGDSTRSDDLRPQYVDLKVAELSLNAPRESFIESDGKASGVWNRRNVRLSLEDGWDSVNEVNKVNHFGGFS
jgi:hypothetical protein